MAIQPLSTQAQYLRSKITVVLILKIAAVALLYALFFRPADRPQLDAGRMEDRLLGEQAAAAPEDPAP